MVNSSIFESIKRKMVGRENQNAEIGTENIVEINYQSPEVATTTQSQGNVQEGAWALPTVSTSIQTQGNVSTKESGRRRPEIGSESQQNVLAQQQQDNNFVSEQNAMRQR